MQHCTVALQLLLGPGEEEWLKNSMLDSENCHIVIKSYKDHRAQVEAGAKLPSVWPLLEVKMTLTQTSSTDVRAKGELMNRRRFLLWATDRLCVSLHLLSLLFVVVAAVVVVDVALHMCMRACMMLPIGCVLYLFLNLFRGSEGVHLAKVPDA